MRAPLGPTYPVSEFEIEYALDHPRHMPEQEILDLEIGLSSAGAAYTAPRPVDRTVRLRLASLPRGAILSATAIQHINQFIVLLVVVVLRAHLVKVLANIVVTVSGS